MQPVPPFDSTTICSNGSCNNDMYLTPVYTEKPVLSFLVLTHSTLSHDTVNLVIELKTDLILNFLELFILNLKTC